ncbi:MAG: hypothetical protein KGL11_13275 [Alphaproteobacteria bacterium]|nr:hypothetical protein [Alphaproteobacteria bacterium]
MQLNIETFSNVRGGNAFFKAVTHPMAAEKGCALFTRLAPMGRVAVYDPENCADALGQLYDLSGVAIAGLYAQDVDAIGRTALGHRAQPVTALKECAADAVLVACFDAERTIAHIRHLLPDGAVVASLDELRLPDELVTNGARYLDPINFATNFVFFRDAGGLSTRLVTANYWSGYGARQITIWCVLFDQAGTAIARWYEALPQGAGAFTIDSREVRRRFRLGEFTGQIFLHAVGAAGHDVVKYALDVYGTDAAKLSLSCTHDANSWPSALYAGLPAPDKGETVTLWIQNSMPCAIPSGTIGLNLMGDTAVSYLPNSVPAFASRPLDVATLLPKARWPQQIEMHAGKYVVRPRYEVRGRGRLRIAHVNVERSDLESDPKIAELGNLLGKGYLLPAPVLPRTAWRSLALPTPMSTAQQDLPVALIVYDRAGREAARHGFGRLARRDSIAVDVDSLLNGAKLPDDYGHMELVYDFARGGGADGWLHALFRYEDRGSGHAAETSFGAHVFNTVLTYKSEPQSYAGRPPGLSTRLFLRLGDAPYDTLCHLIYPASTPWHADSATELVLYDRAGREIARERIAIPCSGSRFFRYHEMFDAKTRERAGDAAYIVVRDITCRLFGYHGLIGRGGAFSLDHMFGF